MTHAQTISQEQRGRGGRVNVIVGRDLAHRFRVKTAEDRLSQKDLVSAWITRYLDGEVQANPRETPTTEAERRAVAGVLEIMRKAMPSELEAAVLTLLSAVLHR